MYYYCCFFLAIFRILTKSVSWNFAKFLVITYFKLHRFSGAIKIVIAMRMKLSIRLHLMDYSIMLSYYLWAYNFCVHLHLFCRLTIAKNGNNIGKVFLNICVTVFFLRELLQVHEDANEEMIPWRFNINNNSSNSIYTNEIGWTFGIWIINIWFNIARDYIFFDKNSLQGIAAFVWIWIHCSR